MVKLLLNIQGDLQIDASDALGIAICHANFYQTQQRLQIGMKK
jgi:crossover junction endodeoxyribonuclease RuvC